VAVLKPKGTLKRVSEKASKVAADDPGRFRVVHAVYVSRHKTRAEASAAMKKVKLKGDDIAFIVEEK